MAAINSETPAVDIKGLVGSNLAGSVSDLYKTAATPVIAARTKRTATDTATLTTDQLFGGYLQATPTAAATYTMPTAAALVAGLRSSKTPAVGDSIDCTIVNVSGGANTITVAAGTGGTLKGTAMTIAQNKVGRITVYVTNVTASSEAYDYTVTSFA